MYKSLMRLKRNILEYATNTIIQCSAMDPRNLQDIRNRKRKQTCRPSPEDAQRIRADCIRKPSQDPHRIRKTCSRDKHAASIETLHRKTNRAKIGIYLIVKVQESTTKERDRKSSRAQLFRNRQLSNFHPADIPKHYTQ